MRKRNTTFESPTGGWLGCESSAGTIPSPLHSSALMPNSAPTATPPPPPPPPRPPRSTPPPKASAQL
eukprot:6187090-Pleurochrysis_carterae.AAC.1